MKRTIITFCLLLAASLVWAQEIHTAEYFELSAPIPSAESHAYRAASYIKLKPGFQSRPEAGNYVELKVSDTLEMTEWYYEIHNDDGSITYQYLMYASDSTINHKDVKIIIRTNTLYDKGAHTEVTREYIFEENGKVYWWNPTLQEFTVLYNLGAQPGDSWVIKVGTDSITMQVDAVEQMEYEGTTYTMLQVSDEGDLFSGAIVCGIGHMTSFFPERLMTRSKNYRVEGIRCYWRDGELVFKHGDRDCDEVYQEYHNGIEEDDPSTGSGTLTVYPNPTDGILNVRLPNPPAPFERGICDSPTEYRIRDLMGQTLMSGIITTDNQQIDVSNLSQGMYFISIGNLARKFVVR